jgi:biotin synthase
MEEFEKIAEELALKDRHTEKTVLRILKHNDTMVIKGLVREADLVRKKYMGDDVHVRAIIEFSNYCEKDCLYCGIRKSNDKLGRYRMTTEEIFDVCAEIKECGYKTVVLQSGEDRFYRADDLAKLVRSVKEELKLAITLSVGELPRKELVKLRDAGADRYLLKFETSDKEQYGWLKPGSSYNTRMRCLSELRELGFQVGSGIMVGLPGQTEESIARDIMLFDDLGLDMVGIGPFIPHPETPLRNAAPTNLDFVLRVVALARMLTINAHIPATTALGTLAPDGRKKALGAGANIVMADVTPMRYRELYEIYPNRVSLGARPSESMKAVERLVSSAGRAVGKGYGHSHKLL